MINNSKKAVLVGAKKAKYKGSELQGYTTSFSAKYYYIVIPNITFLMQMLRVMMLNIKTAGEDKAR